MTKERIEGRAVVLGAGMAGLLAARVLSDAYADVVVIERDTLPDGVAPRRGVAQGEHAHALLARGQQLLDDLFPGFTAELVADGAVVGDVVADARMILSGHRLRAAPSGLVVVSASRPFLEGHVRARVRSRPAVRMLERADVVGLTVTADGRRVTGVRIIRRDDHSTDEVIEADAVIDATGRLSRAPAWLEAIGSATPHEDRVALDLAYASRRYRLGAEVLDGDVAVVHGLTPGRPRGGVLARLEDDTAVVTLAGILGDRPPTDPHGFEGFAASLAHSDIHDAIRRAEPIDDPVPYRFPASTRRRYELARRLPEGFACLGDSMCSLNPVYGQGMTMAALAAAVLDRHVARHGRIRSARLHRELAKVTEPAWQLVTGADLAFPGVTGRPTAMQRVLGRYVERLHAAAATDGKLAIAFARVSGLVDPPQALLRPRVARHVLLR